MILTSSAAVAVAGYIGHKALVPGLVLTVVWARGLLALFERPLVKKVMAALEDIAELARGATEECSECPLRSGRS